jgi:hypothetical protein
VQPDQAVEEVMQIVARGNAALAVDKCLIGLTGRQLQLIDELPARQQSVSGSHLLQGPATPAPPSTRS